MLGNQRSIAALRAGTFDLQTQGRAFLERRRQLVEGALGIRCQIAGTGGKGDAAQVLGIAAGDQATDELEWRLGGAQHQVAQGLPDDRHDAELRIVQVAGHRQFDGDLAFGVLEQGHCQANRQIHRIRAFDLLTKLQLLDHHFVLGFELALGDDVVQVDVQPALADAKASELA
ncbi:hypothetical protein D3C75_837330 [compost metagenome]